MGVAEHTTYKQVKYHREHVEEIVARIRTKSDESRPK